MTRPVETHGELLQAVIKTAQYLASLLSEQEVWQELDQMLRHFFGTDLTVWFERSPEGRLRIHRFSLRENLNAPPLNAEALMAAAGSFAEEVMDSGFLVTEQIELPLTPERSFAVALLPMELELGRFMVLLVGHGGQAYLPRSLLDVYLAVAGLCASTLNRVAAERRLRRLADNIPEMLFQLRVFQARRGKRELGFTHVSSGARLVFGLSPDDLRARPQLLLELLAPEDALLLRTTLEHESRLLLELRWHAPQGGTRHVRFNAVATREEDGSLVWDGSAADITERKAQEEELERYRQHLEELVASRTRELESARDAANAANRAKSVFLSNMSHELRTPLNAILGYAQLLDRNLGLDQEVRRNIATINRSGKHLLSLINDVLEIARIESGRVVIQSEPFDLDDTLRMMEEMTKIRAEGKGLRFTLEREGALPRFVVGDGHRLRQVLLNLLGNAVKYTDRGGITLYVTALEGERVRFDVSDTGGGIGPEDQRRIFQAFYQTADGVARADGAGLGLAISHEYVHLMGGELRVESKVGFGSRFGFTLHLPVSGELLPQRSAPRRVIGLLPNRPIPKLLVVEDHAESQRLLVTLLELVGFPVQAVGDGEAAIRAFEEWHPDLIWMDMRLPVMDGYEATRRIRALPGGREVKIVSITASAFDENRGAILEAGCDDVFAKPLEESRLFSLMEQMLGVQYRYDEGQAETAPSTERLDLSTLPSEVRQALRQSSETLDQEATGRAIAAIRALDGGLADALERLVNDFRFDEVLRLCEESDGPVRSGE